MSAGSRADRVETFFIGTAMFAATTSSSFFARQCVNVLPASRTTAIVTARALERQSYEREKDFDLGLRFLIAKVRL